MLFRSALPISIEQLSEFLAGAVFPSSFLAVGDLNPALSTASNEHEILVFWLVGMGAGFYGQTDRCDGFQPQWATSFNSSFGRGNSAHLVSRSTAPTGRFAISD